MPTENRSSNTEMVSVPREHELKIRQTPLADLLSGLKTGEVRDCSDREFAVGDTVLLREIDDARDYTGTVLRRTITHVQKHFGLPDHLCVLSYGQPAPEPHPEPIAWMVGTAIWWTKEEAERDSAATGLPIVGLGPMTCAAPAEQHQGERAPVEPDDFKVISLGVNDSDGPPYKLSLTGDSITEGIDLLGKGLGRIIEQEVMADFERVERVAFEKWAVEAGFEDDALNQGDAVPAWWAWQARTALKRKQ